MGLSSSQARLLHLTGRMHQIEYKAAKLEAEKLQMANESTRVYEEYQNALEATKIQYKSLNTDGSVTFHDATIDDFYFGTAGTRYGLFSTENGHMYIQQDIANAYESNKTSPSAFATAMTGYTPPVIPTTPTVSGDINSVYTPSASDVPENNDISLSLGESKRSNIDSPITVTLNNGIGVSSQYKYQVESTNGSKSNVTFQYLDNGRLVISGDNLKITANSGQADDIILIGHNNVLDTGDGDDIVRLGQVIDSSSISGSTSGNVVKTGSGKDHITVGTNGNTIADSDANTTVWYLSKDVKTQTNRTSLPNSQEAYYYKFSPEKNSTAGTLGREGYSSQGSANDCRFFSLINSLGRNTNNGDLSRYVTITQNGNKYNVKFKNYSGSGRNNIDITKTEAENYTGVSGDITTVLTNIAINKLMYLNKDDSDLQSGATNETNAFSRAQYRTISKYFFGNDNFAMYGSIPGSSKDQGLNQLVTLWNDYTAGRNNVTNITVGFSSDNTSLGIVSGHAFSVKNVVANQYVELVNPWDDADVLKLDWNTFKSYFNDVYTFGSNYNIPGVFTNVASATPSANNNESVLYVANNAGTGSDTEWNYYYNMHQEITRAGGYETIPTNMRQNPAYLTNLINSGLVYMKEFNNKQNAFLDTSVATNTNLQEVSDESNLRKAEAKYEADMKRIDNKDKKYDYDLAALDNERNATKEEMETLKTVAKDNVERTFKLFG